MRSISDPKGLMLHGLSKQQKPNNSSESPFVKWKMAKSVLSKYSLPMLEHKFAAWLAKPKCHRIGETNYPVHHPVEGALTFPPKSLYVKISQRWRCKSHCRA